LYVFVNKNTKLSNPLGSCMGLQQCELWAGLFTRWPEWSSDFGET